MKDKTIFELASRLNEIMVERNKLDLKVMQLDKEYDDIVYELWERLPHLKEDENIQLKRRIKVK